MQFLNQKSISSILLYIFIALLPVQLGTFFFFRFSYISGVKIDYLAPALYLTDICAVLLIICNARYVYKKLHKHIILILLLFLINALFASHTAIGMYHFAKILEIAGLFIVIKNIHLDYKKLIIILLVSTLVEFLLCIGQMLSASSLQGIFYYLGERSFNLSTPGIAKVSLHGKEILRPYGTFSHPNSLAGFYLLFYTFILLSQRFTHNARLKYIRLGLISLLIFFSF